MLKHLVYGLRKDSNYENLYLLIKRGLIDQDGRVRNNTVYTTGNYRGFELFENPEHYVFMFFDLYKEFTISDDPKVKKSLARAIEEFRCGFLWDIMHGSKQFIKYQNIIDKVDNFLYYG